MTDAVPGSDVGPDMKAIYRFEWDDGSERRTDNLENKDKASSRAIEALAEYGRLDPECEVTLVGFES